MANESRKHISFLWNPLESLQNSITGSTHNETWNSEEKNHCCFFFPTVSWGAITIIALLACLWGDYILSCYQEVQCSACSHIVMAISSFLQELLGETNGCISLEPCRKKEWSLAPLWCRPAETHSGFFFLFHTWLMKKLNRNQKKTCAKLNISQATLAGSNAQMVKNRHAH